MRSPTVALYFLVCWRQDMCITRGTTDWRENFSHLAGGLSMKRTLQALEGRLRNRETAEAPLRQLKQRVWPNLASSGSGPAM